MATYKWAPLNRPSLGSMSATALLNDGLPGDIITYEESAGTLDTLQSTLDLTAVIDRGSVSLLTDVQFTTSAQNAGGWSVDVSSDGIAWTLIEDAFPGFQTPITIPLTIPDGIVARYVRLYVFDRSTDAPTSGFVRVSDFRASPDSGGGGSCPRPEPPTLRFTATTAPDGIASITILGNQ